VWCFLGRGVGGRGGGYNMSVNTKYPYFANYLTIQGTTFIIVFKELKV